MSLPGVLLPYQQRWIKDKSRVRVWEKSRRIGASWTCAAESVIEAAQLDGVDTWYTSYNKETTQEFIRDCAAWSKILRAVHNGVTEELEQNDEGEEVLTYVIRFASGHRITALSSKPSNLRNRKGRIIIDEAAHIPDLAETRKAAMAILMWGGRVDILSTHNGVEAEFNKIVDDTRSGRKNYSLHHTTLDDAIEEGLFRRICLVIGEEWTKEKEKGWKKDLLTDYGDDAAEELYCIPQRSGGAYLSRLLIEDQMHEAPVHRFEAPENFAQRPDKQRAEMVLSWARSVVTPSLSRLPKGLMHAFGEDFGRSADLTVIAPVTIEQDLRRSIPFLVELRDVPFREQEVILNFVVDALPRFTYGALDATGNGQYMAERAWQRYGKSKIEQVNLSEKWYGENLPPMKAGFEDNLLTVPRDADVLTDLLSFQVINGIPKLPKTKTTQKAGARKGGARRHGDAAIAISLGHYASRRPAPSYEYKSVGRRKSQSSGMVRAARSGFRAKAGGVF